jgi:hypothetical protein
VKLAGEDDDVLTWLATKGEPGLLNAAGKGELMPCARLHLVWQKALAERPPESYPALVVPLQNALKRCPAELDGVVADAITKNPATNVVTVGALDAFASYGGKLRATCAALPAAAVAKSPPIIRERARDAIGHMCVLK